MARPRCDVFDAAAARAAIADGRGTARQVYEAYCATAARPYARSTWELMLRRRPQAAEAAAAARPYARGELGGDGEGGGAVHDLGLLFSAVGGCQVRKAAYVRLLVALRPRINEKTPLIGKT